MQRPIDREEIDRLTLEILPAAWRMAMRLSGDPNEAEELVQETLLRVLKKWRAFHGDSTFETWFFRVMVNAQRDRLRKSRTEEPLTQPIASRLTGAAEFVINNETAARVMDEINRMPQRQREVAAVCIGEGIAPMEAALVLGTDANNVRVTLHVVRKRIAKTLGLTRKER